MPVLEILLGVGGFLLPTIAGGVAHLLDKHKNFKCDHLEDEARGTLEILENPAVADPDLFTPDMTPEETREAELEADYPLATEEDLGRYAAAVHQTLRNENYWIPAIVTPDRANTDAMVVALNRILARKRGLRDKDKMRVRALVSALAFVPTRWEVHCRRLASSVPVQDRIAMIRDAERPVRRYWFERLRNTFSRRDMRLSHNARRIVRVNGGVVEAAVAEIIGGVNDHVEGGPNGVNEGPLGWEVAGALPAFATPPGTPDNAE